MEEEVSGRRWRLRSALGREGLVGGGRGFGRGGDGRRRRSGLGEEEEARGEEARGERREGEDRPQGRGGGGRCYVITWRQQEIIRHTTQQPAGKDGERGRNNGQIIGVFGVRTRTDPSERTATDSK